MFTAIKENLDLIIVTLIAMVICPITGLLLGASRLIPDMFFNFQTANAEWMITSALAVFGLQVLFTILGVVTNPILSAIAALVWVLGCLYIQHKRVMG